jgi:hypothetical protein
MNILILGCSFGVPGAGCPAEFHTENQLRLLGHKVINCARSGSSNLESLSIAKEISELLSSRIDWIVWFHTELLRDFRDIAILSKNTECSSVDKAAAVVYNEYKKFVETTKAKIAIIGGAGPVHPSLYSYITPDFCIPSWFNQILNLNLPQIQTLSRLDIVEKMQSVGNLTKLEILEDHEEILNALEASSDFPDNYHPGPRPHQELAQTLHKIFIN